MRAINLFANAQILLKAGEAQPGAPTGVGSAGAGVLPGVVQLTTSAASPPPEKEEQIMETLPLCTDTYSQRLGGVFDMTLVPVCIRAAPWNTCQKIIDAPRVSKRVKKQKLSSGSIGIHIRIKTCQKICFLTLFDTIF